MKVVILIFAFLCLWLKLAMGQPALPKMERQLVWIQPNVTNVNGYELRWGTNLVMVDGISNTTTTIKLAEGVNTVVLRSVRYSGTNIYSDPVTNIVQLIKYDFDESTNGGSTWLTRTGFTYAVEQYNRNALFRAKVTWLTP